MLFTTFWAYISSSHASSVIAKAKADAWQTTCFSLSPESNLNLFTLFALSLALLSGLSPYPLLLSEASLPPLRVTLTHFTLTFYERALRLPTSFLISGLASDGVKPRLSRSSWRAFAFTHPLMLASTFSRKVPLAFPPSPWNLPSFTVESTLFSLCSRSDPSLSRQGAALTHLDSLPAHDLVLWTDGSVSFSFGKGGSGVLAHCSLCGTEATLFFSAGLVVFNWSALTL